jgi:hypothetical protein
VLAYHIREGQYGDVALAGLNVVVVAGFSGNAWAGEAQMQAGFFLDARADDRQREALEMIFSGQAGGWMGGFSRLIREVRGKAVAPITFELDGDLAHWRVEIPGQVRAGAVALTGPTADPSKRVQLLNPPGSEVGPSGTVATWGRSTEAFWEAFGFQQNFVSGRSSKHLPFEWSGPDQP